LSRLYFVSVSRFSAAPTLPYNEQGTPRPTSRGCNQHTRSDSWRRGPLLIRDHESQRQPHRDGPGGRCRSEGARI
jgi:hypothetical protein